MKRILLSVFLVFSGFASGFAAGHLPTAVGTNPTCNGLCNGSALAIAASCVDVVIQSDKLNEIYSFELTDVLGKKVKSMNGISRRQFEISRNGLQNGIYFYKIYTSEHLIGVGKVVIR